MESGTCWFGFPSPQLYKNPMHIMAAYSLDKVIEVVREAEEASLSGKIVVGMLSYESAPAFDPAFLVSPVPCVSGLPLAWFAVYATSESCTSPPCSPNVSGLGEGDKAASPMPRPLNSPSSWAPSMQRGAYDKAIASLRGSIRDGEAYQVNLTLRLRAKWSAGYERDGEFLVALLRAQRCKYGAYLNMGDFRVLSASPELFFSWQRDSGALCALPMKGTRPRGLYAEDDEALRADLRASEKDTAENLMIVDLLRNDMGRLAVPGTVAVKEPFLTTAYPTVWQMTTRVTAQTRPGCTLLDILRSLFPCGSITGAPKVSAMRIIESLEGCGRGVYCGALLHLSPFSGDVQASVPIRTLLLDSRTGQGVYGVGGGVTWDSKAEGEWDEAWAKAAVLFAACGSGSGSGEVDKTPTTPPPSCFFPQTRITPPHMEEDDAAQVVEHAAQRRPGPHLPPSPLSVSPWFDLLETLRLERGGGEFFLLREHMERLQSSACFLGFPWDETAMVAALEDFRRALLYKCTTPERGPWKVRLGWTMGGKSFCTGEALTGDGEEGVLVVGGCSYSYTPYFSSEPPPPPLPSPSLPQAIFSSQSTPVHHRHPLLYHKTTDRSVYQVPREAAACEYWRERERDSPTTTQCNNNNKDKDKKEKGDPQSFFDVLLCNELGFITEFTIGNCVLCRERKVGGLEFVTPPVSSGCLPGVFRRFLLEGGGQHCGGPQSGGRESR